MSTKKLQIIGSMCSNVELDKTLTQEGMAADAKAVGDALDDLETKINTGSGGSGSIDIDLDGDGSNIGEAPPINAHLLNGRSPEEYIALANDYTNQQVKKAAPRNLLDNSDFRNPVNQRGIVNGTVISAYSYSIDRWKTIDLPYTYMCNANGLYASEKMNLLQFIPNAEKLVGKTLTFAAKCSGKVLIATRKIVGSTSWDWTPNDGFSIEANSAAIVEDGNGRVYVQIGLHAEGDYLEWAALYEGEYTVDTLPEYQPKGYGAELAECQRYYYQIAPFAPFGLGFVDWDGKMVTLTIPIGVQMRVNPSVLENITVYLRGLFANGFTITGKTPKADVVSNTIKLTYSDVLTDTQYAFTPVIAQLGSDVFVFNADL